MKKIRFQKLDFKKTNIVELNSEEASKIYGGTACGIDTDPRSIFTGKFCLNVQADIQISL
ncbi:MULTISPECIES: class I lanthipeptide [unclassified Flavobacterium]|uniref:class I lanthipeptide n=1 Tax=unclassified Flavobacterium TaxID=196869 RepID=UPI00360B0920